MAATLPQALDALAKATEKLAHSSSDGSGYYTFWATVGLVLVTLAYVIFTGYMVRHTRRMADETREAAAAARVSAQAAARSAKAAEDMVRVERDRLYEESRPLVNLSIGGNKGAGSGPQQYHVDLNNQLGKGPAQGLQVFGVTRAGGEEWEWRLADPAKLPDQLDGGSHGLPAVVFFLVPFEAHKNSDHQHLLVGHYIDGFGNLYHSVYDTKANPLLATYGPRQGLPPKYRDACRACRDGNS